MRLMLVSLIALLIALALAVPALRWVSRKMLFPAPGPPPVSGAKERGDVEVLQLSTGAEAWLLKPVEGVTISKRAPVLVFAHGNAELIDSWLLEFREPQKWGVAVLLVEYPGYGRSGGRPTEASITSTMTEAHDLLTSREDIDATKIVAYGRSLGGGAAAALAKERRVAALILESTFTSVTRVAADMGFPAFVVSDPFDNATVVESFDGPILGIHGKADQMIPYRHAQELAKAGKDYRLITLSCGHNDCPRVWPEIREFLRAARVL